MNKTIALVLILALGAGCGQADDKKADAKKSVTAKSSATKTAAAKPSATKKKSKKSESAIARWARKNKIWQ